MTTYLRRRLWQSLLVLFGVSVVVFLILHLTGDPAALLLPPDATAEDIAKFRTAMGFDDPVAVQYLRFLKGAVEDFGAFDKFFIDFDFAQRCVKGKERQKKRDGENGNCAYYFCKNTSRRRLPAE